MLHPCGNRKPWSCPRCHEDTQAHVELLKAEWILCWLGVWALHRWCWFQPGTEHTRRYTQFFSRFLRGPSGPTQSTKWCRFINTVPPGRWPSRVKNAKIHLFFTGLRAYQSDPLPPKLDRAWNAQSNVGIFILTIWGCALYPLKSVAWFSSWLQLSHVLVCVCVFNCARRSWQVLLWNLQFHTCSNMLLFVFVVWFLWHSIGISTFGWSNVALKAKHYYFP